MIYAVVSVSPQARQVMSGFITNLEAGDEVAALAQCDSSVSAYSVTQWRTQAQANAPVTIFQNIAFPMPANLGHGWGKSYIGATQFKTATGMQMQYSFELIRVDDQFKVVRFIVPGFATPTTVPALPTGTTGGAGNYGGGSSGGTKARP